MVEEAVSYWKRRCGGRGWGPRGGKVMLDVGLEGGFQGGKVKLDVRVEGEVPGVAK